jgi:hypothetical protein
VRFDVIGGNIKAIHAIANTDWGCYKTLFSWRSCMRGGSRLVVMARSAKGQSGVSGRTQSALCGKSYVNRDGRSGARSAVCRAVTFMFWLVERSVPRGSWAVAVPRGKRT